MDRDWTALAGLKELKDRKWVIRAGCWGGDCKRY